MTEYRGLSSTIRQIIFEDVAQEWLKAQGARYESVNRDGFLYGYVYLWDDTQGKWKYVKPNTKRPSNKAWSTKDETIESLINSYPKNSRSTQSSNVANTTTNTADTSSVNNVSMPNITGAQRTVKVKELSDDDKKLQKNIKNIFHPNEEAARDLKFYETHKDRHVLPEDNKLFKFSDDIKDELFGKVSSVHITELERLMNVRVVKGKNSTWDSWSKFSAGEGSISSRAGELLTLVATCLPREKSDKMLDDMKKHAESQLNAWVNQQIEKGVKRANKKNFKSAAIDTSWIQAAKGNRNAIQKFLKKKYGKNVDITHGAWDNESEVTALGLPDYKINKGDTTDVYFRVKVTNEDGSTQTILHEVSLKKSSDANLSNRGAGYFIKWDKNLPNNINQTVYTTKLKEKYKKFFSEESKREGIEDALSNILGKKNHEIFQDILKKEAKSITKDNRKFLLTTVAPRLKSHYNKRNNRNEEAVEAIDNFITDVKTTLPNEFIENSHAALMKQGDLQKNLLEHLSETLPLKDIFSEEEQMAIGPYSLEKSVLQKIFNVDNYEQLTTKLKIKKSDNPPPQTYLAYNADSENQKDIPIAGFYVREDKVGYGGAFNFEMAFLKDFTKLMEKYNGSDFYNESYEEHKKRLENENK